MKRLSMWFCLAAGLGLVGAGLMADLRPVNLARAAGEPGPVVDPLVSRAYLEETVARQLADLVKGISGLEQRVSGLQQRAQVLESGAYSQPPSLGTEGLEPLVPAGEATPDNQVPAPSPSLPGGQAEAGSGAGEENTPAAAQPADAWRLRVIVSAANVRQGPSTTTSRLLVLPRDAVVEGLREEGGWYEIQLPAGGRGWLRSDLVQLEE